MSDDQTPMLGFETGAPPPSNPARWWRYVRTQWNRFLGLNATRLTETIWVGGQFRATQWPLLRAKGVRAVLSLQAEHTDAFHGTPPDAALRIAVEDFHPPTVEQLQQAVDFITQAHAANQPVLIHCYAGVGRASLTTCAYLVAQGMSADDAFAYVRRERPIVRLNGRQWAGLRAWEAHVQARKSSKNDPA